MSKRRRYCFLWVFRKYTDQKFHGFLLYMLQFLDDSLTFFSNYKREVDHFMLDLLKRSDT